MYRRMTKVLLALGLMTAAGPSGAMFVISGAGHTLPKDGYCGQLFFSDQSGRGVMDVTMLGCQVQLNNEIAAATKPITTVEACHLCKQRFGSVPVTAMELPPRVLGQFLEGTQRLREEFRIEDYEHAQREFEQSIRSELKP
jgi:hypothetical protein